MNDERSRPFFQPTRRVVVVGGAALIVGAGVPGAMAAKPLSPAILKATGGVVPKEGRIKIDIPRISESGNSVSMGIVVDSPMTAADHVKSIDIVAPRNPFPNVATFHIGPRAGRAKVSTNIRLALTQDVYAVAAMSDGSFWMAHQEVLVTIAACIDGGM